MPQHIMLLIWTHLLHRVNITSMLIIQQSRFESLNLHLLSSIFGNIYQLNPFVTVKLNVCCCLGYVGYYYALCNSSTARHYNWNCNVHSGDLSSCIARWVHAVILHTHMILSNLQKVTFMWWNSFWICLEVQPYGGCKEMLYKACFPQKVSINIVLWASIA